MNLIRTYWKWLAAIVVVLVVVAKFKLMPIPVEAHTVAQEDIVAEVMGTGTLEARVKTTISPRIQERLAEVLVDQNDFVREGQLLARLDDRELKGQVEVALAALQTAGATVNRVQADEARAEAVEHQARQDHKRVSDLVATRVSSQSELDKAVEQLRVAESDLKRARAATIEARQGHHGERNLAFHQERLQFTAIRSPYDGLVTRRDRDAGGVVVPGALCYRSFQPMSLVSPGWMRRLRPRSRNSKALAWSSGPAAAELAEWWRAWGARPTARRANSCGRPASGVAAKLDPGQRAEVFIATGRRTQSCRSHPVTGIGEAANPVCSWSRMGKPPGALWCSASPRRAESKSPKESQPAIAS